MEQSDFTCPIMNDDTSQRLTQHDVQLAKIETTLDQMAKSLDRLSNSLEKQSDLIVSFVNAESNFKASVARIHDRIDQTREEINLLEARCGDFQKSIAPITFFVKNPKVAAMTAIGLYVLTFKEVRDAVFATFGG